MTDEVARLAVTVDSASAASATSMLDTLKDVASAAETAFKSLSQALGPASTQFDKLADQLKGARTGKETKKDSKDLADVAQKTMEDLAAKAADSAGVFTKVVGDLNTGLADVLASAALKGKANIKGLVTSILTEVAKLEASRLAAGLLSYAINLFLPRNSIDSPSNFSLAGGEYSGPGSLSTSWAGDGTGSSAGLGSLYDLGSGTSSDFSGFNLMQSYASPSVDTSSIVPASFAAPMAFSAPDVGASNAQVAVTVNVGSDGGVSGGMTSHDADGFGREMGQQMQAVAEQVVARNLQPGGKLWRANGRV